MPNLPKALYRGQLSVADAPGGAWSSSGAMPAVKAWRGVCYGNGQFVAVSGGATDGAVRSTDGVTWTVSQIPVNATFNSVAYGNGMYVAVGNANILVSSPDGVSWTQRTSPTATSNWRGVTYANGLFVAVGSISNFITSPDGITWTARASGLTQIWSSVTYGNGTFVAVGPSTSGSNTCATSPDGITWSLRTMASSITWSAVAYGNGTFVAVASSQFSYNTSTDGITWVATNRTLPTFGGANWLGLTFANGAFIAVADTTTAAVSPDGIVWAPVKLPISAQWYAAAAGNGVLVAMSGAATSAVSSTTGAVLYTVPAGTTAVLTDVLVSNETESAAPVVVSVDSAAHPPRQAVPAYSHAQIPTRQVLTAGKVIHGYAIQPVTVHLNGQVIT